MRFLKFLGYAAAAVFFILIGFIIRNYPYIEWKKDVTIAEVANFCVTLGVGAIIPIVIYRAIDSKRNQKNELVEDIKNSIITIQKVKDRIDACFNNGQITPADKTAINVLFEEAQDRIYNITVYLDTILGEDGNKIRNEISKAYDNYWDTVTGGSLMATNYTVIDQTFQLEQLNKWGILQQTFKKAILTIHKI